MTIGCTSHNGYMTTSTSTQRRVTSKASIDGMIKLSRMFADANVPYLSHDNPQIAEVAIAHLQLGEWIKSGNLYPASNYRHVIQGDSINPLEGLLQ